jgi:hypothetical protein
VTKKITRAQEQGFYADPANETPKGPPRRRKAKLTELVPVRFPRDTLEKLRTAADADDRGFLVDPTRRRTRAGNRDRLTASHVPSMYQRSGKHQEAKGNCGEHETAPHQRKRLVTRTAGG